MSSNSNNSSSMRSSECDLVFDSGNHVSPVPEEVYELYDLNVYSLGARAGTISRSDRDPKDPKYWSSAAVSFLLSLKSSLMFL